MVAGDAHLSRLLSLVSCWFTSQLIYFLRLGINKVLCPYLPELLVLFFAVVALFAFVAVFAVVFIAESLVARGPDLLGSVCWLDVSLTPILVADDGWLTMTSNRLSQPESGLEIRFRLSNDAVDICLKNNSMRGSVPNQDALCL